MKVEVREREGGRREAGGGSEEVEEKWRIGGHCSSRRGGGKKKGNRSKQKQIQAPLYPKTGAGLIACYTAAIPFFWNTLMGNLAFGSVLFGVYEYILSRQAKRAEMESEQA